MLWCIVWKVHQFSASPTVQMFGMSQVEALPMDPQQRLLLEETFKALRDGYPVTGLLNGTETGVIQTCVGYCVRKHLESLNSQHPTAAFRQKQHLHSLPTALLDHLTALSALPQGCMLDVCRATIQPCWLKLVGKCLHLCALATAMHSS